MLVIAQDGKPIYIQTTGNTALASREKELVGHGTLTHPDGFGSREIRRNQFAIEDMSPKT
jgi:phenylalanine-4-hydroxylase